MLAIRLTRLTGSIVEVVSTVASITYISIATGANGCVWALLARSIDQLVVLSAAHTTPDASVARASTLIAMLYTTKWRL